MSATQSLITRGSRAPRPAKVSSRRIEHDYDILWRPCLNVSIDVRTSTEQPSTSTAATTDASNTLTSTTATTVAGLTPLLLEKSRQAQWLKPMAISVSYGIAFATIFQGLILQLYLQGLRRIR